MPVLQRGGEYIPSLLDSVKAIDNSKLQYFDVKNTAAQVVAVYEAK